MEGVTLTLHGEHADRFADELVDAKAEEVRRSINKRGARNLHRYDGDGLTQFVFEQASAYQDSWLMVSILAERVDERTTRVVVYIGGGGRGPFKLEELNLKRILDGPESVGAAGRAATVLRDIERVCESLDLDVETGWESEPPEGYIERLTHEIFHA